MCNGCKHEAECAANNVLGLMPQPASCYEPVGRIEIGKLRKEKTAPAALRLLGKKGSPAQPA